MPPVPRDQLLADGYDVPVAVRPHADVVRMPTPIPRLATPVQLQRMPTPVPIEREPTPEPIERAPTPEPVQREVTPDRLPNNIEIVNNPIYVNAIVHDNPVYANVVVDPIYANAAVVDMPLPPVVLRRRRIENPQGLYYFICCSLSKKAIIFINSNFRHCIKLLNSDIIKSNRFF